MNLQNITIAKNCRRAEIGAYLDGELMAHEELLLEAHVAACKDCMTELNLQKQILRALDFSFDRQTEIELPRDFAKIVAARAESGVSGLRSKEERFRALFLCAALFLIVLIGLGAETKNVLSNFGKFGEQLAAITVFTTHLIFNLAIGTAVVLRSFGEQFIFRSEISLAAVAGLFMLSAVMLSRLIFQFNRS